MTSKSLKELNDIRNDPRFSDEVRAEAQEEWERQHKLMAEQQDKEKFENSFWSGE